MNDRFWRKADIGLTGIECPLWRKADIRRGPALAWSATLQAAYVMVWPTSSSVGSRPCGVSLSTTSGSLPLSPFSSSSLDRPVCSIRPRVWFENGDLNKLLEMAASHVGELAGTRWVHDGHECYDFIVWMVNTGMRVGEAMNVRFCDVEVIQELAQNDFTEYCCLVKNIKGKRGTGECRSGYAALDAFDRIVARRNIEKPSQSDEKLFLALHRDMFNAILEKASLKMTNTDPPRRRDFVSLRHTYIASRLLHGVGVYDLAKNCRTSVTMIENHYARYLSPRLLKNLNRISEN